MVQAKWTTSVGGICEDLLSGYCLDKVEPSKDAWHYRDPEESIYAIFPGIKRLPKGSDL